MVVQRVVAQHQPDIHGDLVRAVGRTAVPHPVKPNDHIVAMPQAGSEMHLLPFVRASGGSGGKGIAAKSDRGNFCPTFRCSRRHPDWGVSTFSRPCSWRGRFGVVSRPLGQGTTSTVRRSPPRHCHNNSTHWRQAHPADLPGVRHRPGSTKANN